MKRKRKLRKPDSTFIQAVDVGPANYNKSTSFVNVGGYVFDPIGAKELAKYLIKFAAWAKQEEGKKKKK